MAEASYFADDATLTLEDNAGTPATIPVGSLKGVNITLQADHIELTSGDTILREDVKKRNLSVNVEIDVAAFDVNVMKTWIAGDSTDTAQTSVVDTTDVALYGISGTFTEVGGGTTVTVDVDEVYFEEMPVFDAQEGEYVVKNLQGTGKTISTLSEA